MRSKVFCPRISFTERHTLFFLVFFVAFAHFIIRTIKTNEMLIIQKEHKQQICSSLYVIKWIKDVTLVPWDYLKSTKYLLKCTRLHLFESHLEKSKLKDCYKGSKHTEKQHIPILILNTSKVLLWPDLLVLPLRKIILLNFFLITLIFDLHILYNSGFYNKKIINVNHIVFKSKHNFSVTYDLLNKEHNPCKTKNLTRLI